jgi:RNA polymerase sigma-70 factor (ECF subfamily)
MDAGFALDEEDGVRAAYRAYGPELYGFAFRSLADRGLAEEAVQETFLRAWRAADRFDPSIAPLRTWLYSIMRNVVIDLTRARAARPAVSNGVQVPQEIGVDDFDQALVSWQVEEGLRRLGEDHRRVLVETYYRARPYADVAAELGIPEGTVKSRVYYALRALRLALEEMGWEP